MGFRDRFKDLEIQNTSNSAVSAVNKERNEIETYIIDNLKLKLPVKIASIPVWFDYSEDEKRGLIKSFFENWLREEDLKITDDDKKRLTDILYSSIYGFGVIDTLLSDVSITALFIFEGLPIKICRNGKFEFSDIQISKISDLINRIKKAAGIFSDKPVLKFALKNLIITLVLPPVGEPFAAIKKKTRHRTDFAYLLENNKIDENIYSFLISLINERKNILISGAQDSGKTSYIEALYSAMQNSVLLQNSNFIEEKSYICGALEDEELQNLISAVSAQAPDYIVCDMNNGYSAVPDCALISSIRAEVPMRAVTRLAVNCAAERKITEKQAKAEIGRHFNYIIHLDNDLYISAILELSLNKAGSLVLTEILGRKDDTYSYNFPEADLTAKAVSSATKDIEEPVVVSNSFKSRFK